MAIGGGQRNDSDWIWYGGDDLVQDFGEWLSKGACGIVFKIMNKAINQASTITNCKDWWKRFWQLELGRIVDMV